MIKGLELLMMMIIQHLPDRNLVLVTETLSKSAVTNSSSLEQEMISLIVLLVVVATVSMDSQGMIHLYFKSLKVNF